VSRNARLPQDAVETTSIDLSHQRLATEAADFATELDNGNAMRCSLKLPPRRRPAPWHAI